MQNTVEIKHSF